MGCLSLLFINCFIGLCLSQFLQPLRLVERIRTLHENSNKMIGREDSLSLYVDISEADKYPSRDDLYMRVFNKDRNVTVCDQNMAEFVNVGKFPCNFRASEADLHHGVNRFEFEVYSILDGKRFASQQVPDIHLFDHYLHEGYYDNIYDQNDVQPFAIKTILASLSAVLLAHAIDAGPNTVKIELDRLIINQVKLPFLAISMVAVDVTKAFMRGTSRLFKVVCSVFIRIVQIIAGELAAHLNTLLKLTGMDNFINIKTATDFAYLMNLVESSFRSNLILLAQKFKFLVDVFYAGYTPSSTTGNAPSPPKKKSQIISLKRNNRTPIPNLKPSTFLENESKVVQRPTIETIILSRSIHSSTKKSNLSTPSTLSTRKDFIHKKDGSQFRSRLSNFLRTAGLCIAVLILSPRNRPTLELLSLEKIKMISLNIGSSSSSIVRGLNARSKKVKAFIIQMYKKRLQRSKNTIINQNGVTISTGGNFIKVADGCPYLKNSRNIQ